MFKLLRRLPDGSLSSPVYDYAWTPHSWRTDNLHGLFVFEKVNYGLLTFATPFPSPNLYLYHARTSGPPKPHYYPGIVAFPTVQITTPVTANLD